MPSPIATDYDRVAYPSLAHSQTFPENLANRAWLRGMDPAHPGKCRVLELGCGDGFNLAAMAMIYPESQYTGIDYSSEAIERGRRMLAELELGQIRLEAADIRDPGIELGEYDYIIVHGVYSWVPEDVRDAILSLMDHHLAPQGIGFVSYLAYPGAHLREMLRTMVRFHCRADAAPSTRIRQSRALLELLSNATSEKNHYTEWLKTETTLVASHSDESFFHDELSDISHPVLLTDFLAHAASHSLQFLSEAEYLVPIGRLLTESTRDRLRPLETDRILLEQYLDFVEGRRFRQTLLCRPGLGAELRVDRLERLLVSFDGLSDSPPVAPLDADSPVAFKSAKDAAVSARRPFEKAAMLELLERRDALPFPELRDAVARRMQAANLPLPAGWDQELALFIVKANAPGLIELHWETPAWASRLPDHPRATALALWQIAHGDLKIATLGGTFVKMEGSLGRNLLSLLDGTLDRAGIMERVRAYILERTASGSTRAEGSPPIPSVDDLQLPAQMEQGLLGLLSLKLIRRE